MNNGDLWDIVHMISKKESRGNIIKPGQFSDLLKRNHYLYYAQQFEKYAVSTTSQTSMRPFLVSDEVITLASGEEALADLDNTMHHPLFMRTDADVAIDIVTAMEWNAWMGDSVMQPTASDPIALIDDSTIYVQPDSITSAKFTYLKKADNEPVFDYYTDAYDTVQYLTNGTTYTLGTDEVYSDGTTSGDVTSNSIELEWNDEDKIKIVAFILQDLGISMSAQQIVQYGLAEQQKQNVA